MHNSRFRRFATVTRLPTAPLSPNTLRSSAVTVAGEFAASWLDAVAQKNPWLLSGAAPRAVRRSALWQGAVRAQLSGLWQVEAPGLYTTV